MIGFERKSCTSAIHQQHSLQQVNLALYHGPEAYNVVKQLVLYYDGRAVVPFLNITFCLRKFSNKKRVRQAPDRCHQCVMATDICNVHHNFAFQCSCACYVHFSAHESVVWVGNNEQYPSINFSACSRVSCIINASQNL